MNPKRSLFRRILRALAWTVGGAIVVYLFLLFRFLTGEPSPHTNYLDVLNQPTTQLAAGDCAWPIYRQALLGFDFQPNDEIEAALAEKEWNDVANWLGKHEQDLALLRQGSEKPALGFILGRDGDASDGQLFPQAFAVGGPPQPNPPLISVLLPHLTPLRQAVNALAADARLARQQNDPSRVVADITAMYRMGEQMSGLFLVSDLVGIGMRAMAIQSLDQALNDPNLKLADDDLRQLGVLISKPGGADALVSYAGERLFFADVVQRAYTDDGKGDGRLTKEGLSFLSEISAPGGARGRNQFALQALAVPITAASRREITDEYNRYLDMAQENLKHPYRQATWSAYSASLNRLHQTMSQRVRYLPLVMLLPGLDRSHQTAETFLAQRDGELVAIAINRYHLQTGNLPAALDELIPTFLSSVPADRITGEPLKYRLIDGSPVVYSVGPDRDDDGGRGTLADGKAAWSRADPLANGPPTRCGLGAFPAAATTEERSLKENSPLTSVRLFAPRQKEQEMSFTRLIALSVVLALTAPLLAQTASRKPNFILIIADDLGYGDLGVYGQKQIKTPNLDKLASEGTRFTQFYAGCTVCAPSRFALMTGQTTGHCLVRGNAKVDLRPQDVILPEVLKTVGYSTALVGKWGLGAEGSTGAPNKKGFDFFYGFVDQSMAHNYYPTFLVRNEERTKLRNVVPNEGRYGQGVASEKKDYAIALMQDEILKFIDANKGKPFFMDLSYTLPHANNEARIVEVPDFGPYKSTDWPDSQKAYAAAVTLLDEYVGQLVRKIKDLGLENDTLFLFTSDNGTHQEGGNSMTFFTSSGPLRGMKRDMYEGGIRVPLIARWPGKVPVGVNSDAVFAYWDLLPTFAELSGAKTPDNIDGISFAPTILGKTQPRQHEYLYWEFHEGGFSQAIRMGDWKAIRARGNIELYDLKTDLGETKDVAAANPQVLEKIRPLFTSARTDSAEFPVGQ